jgi:hypothetical protein
MDDVVTAESYMAVVREQTDGRIDNMSRNQVFIREYNHRTDKNSPKYRETPVAHWNSIVPRK